MKRKINVIFTVLFTLIVSVCMLVGCQKEEGKAKATVLEKTEKMVVIQVDEVEGETTLLSVMRNLQAEGELSFSIAGGMLTELNGIANDADYNPCWMLYTSDSELSNQEWGTVEYDGQVFGSAIIGVETLTVLSGEYYIWSYQSF